MVGDVASTVLERATLGTPASGSILASFVSACALWNLPGINLTTTPRAVETVTIPLAAALLPGFTSDSTSVQQWWELAKRCLIEAHSSEEEVGQLDETIPTLSSIVRAESQKRTARNYGEAS